MFGLALLARGFQLSGLGGCHKTNSSSTRNRIIVFDTFTLSLIF
jgi:hypothetical protein